jgi:hypothetical protein
VRTACTCSGRLNSTTAMAKANKSACDFAGNSMTYLRCEQLSVRNQECHTVCNQLFALTGGDGLQSDDDRCLQQLTQSLGMLAHLMSGQSLCWYGELCPYKCIDIRYTCGG